MLGLDKGSVVVASADGDYLVQRRRAGVGETGMDGRWRAGVGETGMDGRRPDPSVSQPGDLRVHQRHPPPARAAHRDDE
jgi:hypothetical protein